MMKIYAEGVLKKSWDGVVYMCKDPIDACKFLVIRGMRQLRYVYDMFVARFTWLARVISFEAFSMMVDEALERMKKMLESNKAMQTLVSGEAGETVEKDM